MIISDDIVSRWEDNARERREASEKRDAAEALLNRRMVISVTITAILAAVCLICAIGAISQAS